MAARLGVGPAGADQAIQAGFAAQAAAEELAHRGLTIPEVYHRLCGLEKPRRQRFDPAAEYDGRENIAVLGHPYLLYDRVGHRVVERLAEYARVITPEIVPAADYRPEVAAIYEGNRLWAYEARILGAGLSLLRLGKITKMVLVEAFECGPASVIETFLATEADSYGIPFLLLTVDEHTGEAGLVTRLEAFVDTSGGRQRGRLQVKGSTTPLPRRQELRVGAPGMGLLLARERWRKMKSPSAFRGVKAIASFQCAPRSFICNDCANSCEISELYICGEIVGRWGSRCGKWANLRLSSAGREEQREKLSLIRLRA